MSSQLAPILLRNIEYLLFSLQNLEYLFPGHPVQSRGHQVQRLRHVPTHLP